MASVHAQDSAGLPEAASLFDGDQAASDFFAFEQNIKSASDEVPKQASDNHQLLAGSDSADLFGSDSNNTIPFEVTSDDVPLGHEQHSEYLTTSALDDTYGQHDYNYGHNEYTGENSAEGGGASQYAEGWYDEYGQWNTYTQNDTSGAHQDTQSHVNSGTSAYNYAPPPHTSSYAPYTDTPPTSYDPYRPTSSSFVSQPTYAASPTYQASTYNYGPAYAKEVPIPQPQAPAPYDPYKPTSSSYPKPPTRHEPALALAPAPAPSQSKLSIPPPVPEPPKPSKDSYQQYRAPKLNAYDPPVPVSRSRRAPRNAFGGDNPGATYPTTLHNDPYSAPTHLPYSNERPSQAPLSPLSPSSNVRSNSFNGPQTYHPPVPVPQSPPTAPHAYGTVPVNGYERGPQVHQAAYSQNTSGYPTSTPYAAHIANGIADSYEHGPIDRPNATGYNDTSLLKAPSPRHPPNNDINDHTEPSPNDIHDDGSNFSHWNTVSSDNPWEEGSHAQTETERPTIDTAAYGLDDQPFSEYNDYSAPQSSIDQSSYVTAHSVGEADVEGFGLEDGTPTFTSSEDHPITQPPERPRQQRENTISSRPGPINTGYAPPPTSTPYNPYTPYTPAGPQSPSHSSLPAFSSPPFQSLSVSPPQHSYAPISNSSLHQGPSNFNGSPPSQHSYDRPPVAPYAPTRGRQASETSDYGSSLSFSRPTSFYDVNAAAAYSPPQTYSAYQDTTSSTIPSYAPQQGEEDPLGRSKGFAPLINFGFGGKLVTYFSASSEVATGFDVSLSSRHCGPIHIRTLHKVIPSSAVDSSTHQFPGPLFSDPGSPTIGLGRPGAAGANKAKKAAVIKYLEGRAGEIEHGLGYVTVGHEGVERKRAEGRLALVRLLKIMVENDGKINGSPTIEAAVRAALLGGANSSVLGDVGDSTATPLGFTSPIPNAPVDATYGSPPLHQKETPITVHSVMPSSMDKLQAFLLRGERRRAYGYALDEKLWAHALLISSSVDKEAFKEVASEFIRSELGAHPQSSHQTSLNGVTHDLSVSNGREPLRVAYSLFSGQGAAAVQELLPPKSLNRALDSTHVPVTSVIPPTPFPQTFFESAAPSSIRPETLAMWSETAATIYSNQTNGDSAALTTLGDYLIANKWVDAAHSCYMLSPQTSPLGGVGVPSVRVVLVGSDNPLAQPLFHKDSDAVLFTEVLEFALSLVPTVKGQESFAGLPHLQAYRLIRATQLAEMGHVVSANRYCEAITGTLRQGSKASPFYTPTFMEQLKELSDHLSGVPLIDKSSSWIKGKVAKPSLDTIGNWFEGKFTKLIVGEGEEAKSETTKLAASKQGFVGPFSHYSSISSASTSGAPSPTASVTNLALTSSNIPPRRSESAMASRPNNSPLVPIDRASSAMDYLRTPSLHASPPPPRVFSAHPATSSFYQADPSYSSALSYGAMTEEAEGTSTAVNGSSPEGDKPSNENSWWGSTGNEAPSTPAAFVRVDESESPMPASDSGFVSLMDAYSPAPSPMPTPAPGHSRFSTADVGEDDDDELGLGNANRKKKASVDSKSSEEATTSAKQEAAPAKEEAKPAEVKPTASSSWFPRWPFSRTASAHSSSPGPVKANLGEEKSFYYDSELKRWVNKKRLQAGRTDDAAPAAPPPPPSRAQTASPGRATGLAPPPRPQSAVGAAKPPSSSPVPPVPPLPASVQRRVPSGLSESFVPENSSSSSTLAPPTSPLSPSRPPSSMRAKTPGAGGARKNVRARYVDVLQTGEPSK